MMVDYVQDRRHVLKRNPNYRGETYPCEGMPGDKEAGLLDDCGKTMPFIDTLVFNAEKEARAAEGEVHPGLLRRARDRAHRVRASSSRSTWPIRNAIAPELRGEGLQAAARRRHLELVPRLQLARPGGRQGRDTPEQQVRNRKLRQALSIAIDWDEYSRIFPKKGGETAMGPLPGGLFGSRHGTVEGVNPVTHTRGRRQGRCGARSTRRRQLLVEAGYPDGRDAKTGRPLVLNYDYQRVPTPELKPELDWMVKQFAKLGIQLEIRATDYNQFQDKMRKGTQQVFWLGLVRRLPGRRELPVPALRPELEGARPTARTPPTTRTPNTTGSTTQLQTLDDGPEKQSRDRRDGRRSCSRTRPGRWAASRTRPAPTSPGSTTASRRS